MTTLNRNRPQVNPTRALPKPARPFADGLIDPETGRVARVLPYTAADLAWAAYHLNADCTDYEVVASAPAPIAGGAPDYDRLADESAFQDRYERGQV